MIMAVVIVRLNRNEGEPIMSPKMIISVAIVIAAFDATLLAVIGLVVSSGSVVL